MTMFMAVCSLLDDTLLSNRATLEGRGSNFLQTGREATASGGAQDDPR